MPISNQEMYVRDKNTFKDALSQLRYRYGYSFVTFRFRLFAIKWLWKNRKWKNTRQKFKALENDYLDYVIKRYKKK